MKAALLTEYGGPGVIKVRDIPKPAIGEEDILIRTVASSVTQVDNIFRSGKVFFARMATGPIKPKIPVLGTECTGIVEEAGAKVTDFKPGDEVIADSGTHYGAHAEYVKLTPMDPVIYKPGNMSIQEAAALCYGGLTAWFFLKDVAQLKEGQSLLILGGSGSVGSYAIQIAKYLGVSVDAVASGENRDLMLSLGADKAIDYAFSPVLTMQDQYDVVFDSVGKYTFGGVKHLLKESGLFMTTDLNASIVFSMMRTRLMGRKKASISFTGLKETSLKLEGLHALIQMYEEGKLKPVIDRVFPFKDIAEAHAHVQSGHKKGNVVVEMV